MTTDTVGHMLKRLDIAYLKVLPMQSGYRNKNFPIILPNKEIINLVIYKSEPEIFQRIQRINLLTHKLKDSDLPIRYPIEIHGKTIFTIKAHLDLQPPLSRGYVERIGCFYNYLPGETIEWEHYTRKHIKLLGFGMAKLHKSTQNEKLGIKTTKDEKSRSQKCVNFPIFADEMNSQIERMHKYFSDPQVRSAITHKLNMNPPDFQLLTSNFQNLSEHLSTLKSQVLHLDFVRGNVLFQDLGHRSSVIRKGDRSGLTDGLCIDGLELTGIIDFEKTAIGPKIVDIARTLSFLIADCSTYSEKQIIKYFIDSGYAKRGKGTVEHIELLKPLMHYFWLYDFYKFLKHNPYESLRDNYHFRRTIEVAGYR